MPGTYINPTETGFYYLLSRYYDVETCRFLNADGYVSTGQGVLGNNMYAYCNNNPIILCDSNGTRPVVGGSLENETAEERALSCEYMRQLVNSRNSRGGNLNEDQKVLIATIAAEATVAANGKYVSSEARQAMANVVLNRVGKREWSRYSTAAEICQYTGFDGYGDENYKKCMNYLNERDGSNSTYEAIIWDVMAAYDNDITNGCQLYYTPAAMTNVSGVPNWNFSVLTEVEIPGVDSYYEGRFYKYK